MDQGVAEVMDKSNPSESLAAFNAGALINKAYESGELTAVGFGEGPLDHLGRMSASGTGLMNAIRRAWRYNDDLEVATGSSEPYAYKLVELLRSGKKLPQLKNVGSKAAGTFTAWEKYLDFVDRNFPDGVPPGTFLLVPSPNDYADIRYKVVVGGQERQGLIPVLDHKVQQELMLPRASRERSSTMPEGNPYVSTSYTPIPKPMTPFQAEVAFFEKYYGL